MSKYQRQIARILKKWAASPATTAEEFAKQARWPAGAPGSKGGQFAPDKGGAGGKGSKYPGASKPWPGEEGSGATKYTSYASLFGPDSTFPGGDSPKWAGQQNAKPMAPPPGAKPHLKPNDKGETVTVNYPTKPSDKASWTDPSRTATFVPGGDAPAMLNGVAMKPWASVPKSENEWAAVPGQKLSLDARFPFDPTPGKSTGAGVIIREPDGRIWLTKPTNAFGGYQQTFPKGTVEHGLSMQASAIKETWEETGLQIKITGILGDYERTTSKARFYIAERVGGTPADMGWESQAVRLATRKDLDKLLNMGVDKGILEDLDTEGFFEKAAAPQKKGGAWEKQARWPSGTPLGGQWKTMDGDGITMPPKIAGGLAGTNSQYQKKADAAYAAAKAGNKTLVLDTAITLQKKVAENTAKGASSSHAKWTAQLSQFVTQVASDIFAAPKAQAIAERISSLTKLSSWTSIGGKPGGSNPGGMYQDANGQKWLVKGNAQYVSGAVNGKTSDDRAKNEVLAARLMQAAGVGAPDMKLVGLEGKHGGAGAGIGDLGVASKWVESGKALNTNDPSHMKAAQADFAVHAWLGNWDVLGASADNTVIVNGKAVNIDPGGAILFRAQGAPKSAGAFGKDAADFETMRSSNSLQKQVYGSMTKSDLQASASKLAAVTDDTIKELVKTHGPGDEKAKQELADTLIARRDAILAKAGVTKDDTLTGKPAAPAVAAPAPAPEPPKVSQANTPAQPVAGLTKPTFDNSFGKAGYYDGMAQKMLDAHAAGDMAALKAAGLNNKGVTAWPANTFNGKLMAPFHAALIADLEKQQGTTAQALAAGKATITGTDGKTWVGDGKGVLQPTAGGGSSLSEGETSAVYGKVIGIANMPPKGDIGTVVAMMTAAQKGDAAGLAAANPSTVKGKKLKEALLGAMQAKAAPASAGAAPGALSMGGLKAIWTPIKEKWGISSDLEDYFSPTAIGPVKAMFEAALKGDVTTIKATGTNTAAGGEVKAALLAAMGAGPAPAAAQARAAKPVVATPQPVPQPAPKVPTAAPPSFEKAMLPATNTNAPSHNAKISQIKAAFDAGDEKAILALKLGTNTYAKKQVQVANDALAALGSVHQVAVGQAANSHPALTGGTAQAAPSAPKPAPQPSAAPAATGAKRTLTDLTPHNLPTKPDVMNWKGPGQPYSSKAWKNQANIDALNAIEQAALKGGMDAVNALKFPELDPETGVPTGKMLSAAEHPAKKLITAYAIDVDNAIKDFLNPPKKLAAFNTVSAASVQDTAAKFLGTKIGQTVEKQAQDQQFGFWIALGKVADPAVVMPTATKDLSDAEYKAGKGHYQKYSDLTKKWISAVQATGAINRAIDEGKTTYGGLVLKDVVKAIYADATPVSAGSTVYRWQNMPSGMLKQLATAQPGLVFQSQGGMCTSKSATATSHFGKHRMIIRAAPGAKMIHSHGTGGYQSEQELTTIPGQRFVLLDRKKVGDRWDIEVLMLPPDEGFVS